VCATATMIGPNFFIADLDGMLFEVDQGHDRRIGLYAHFS